MSPEAAGLPPGLLDIVVCPADHGELELVEPPADAAAGVGAELVCATCGLAYPVREGIPVLLVDDARRPA